MSTYIYIKADTNDADYVSQEISIKDFTKEEIATIKKVAKVVMSSDKFHNWDNIDNECAFFGDYKAALTEEELELFSGVVPYAEYGVHSIKSVQIREVKTLWDVSDD